jgi:hypothetical protein
MAVSSDEYNAMAGIDEIVVLLKIIIGSLSIAQICSICFHSSLEKAVLNTVRGDCGIHTKLHKG